ncbi:phosphate ABC transporter substrate-binding protein PstS [Modestobacter lapidis]|nr:phosphate ABC transporter substrate-binding protein PstS [Modestobacter lapidis]
MGVLLTAIVVGGCSVALATYVPPNERRTGTAGGEQLEGTLVGAGSSAQQAAMQGWTAGFSALQPGVTVSYDPIGSGGGREQFLSGGIDFAGSDAALDEEELRAAEARCGDAGVFELPNYVSPIAVVTNLEGIDQLNLSPTTLAGIFAGQITRWDDPAIAADNPGTPLPDLRITPVNRSDDSGTTQNFTEYLAAAGGPAWPYEPAGEWPVEGGEAAQGNSGVIAAVAGGQGTIGYTDLSQVGELGVARIRVGEEFVAPSPAAAAAAVEDAEQLPGRGEHDHAVAIDRETRSSGRYPIVLISYHIGCLRQEDPQVAELLKAFLGYVVSEEGQAAAAEVAGSAPISAGLRAQAEAAIEAISGP